MTRFADLEVGDAFLEEGLTAVDYWIKCSETEYTRDGLNRGLVWQWPDTEVFLVII